jgi:MoxR-like ATPase
MKPTQLIDLLARLIPAGLPCLIKGAPGIGKSDIVEQAAKLAQAELIISHPVTSDPTDFKGLPYASDGEAHFLPFGDLNLLIKAQARTVFFLDDLGQAPPAVQAAAMQLILARRINGHHVSPLVTFVAATNRRQDRAAVSGILEPVKSRFATIVELEPDLTDWTRWALSAGLPTELIAFIRFRPELLHKFTPSPDITNSPCPRTVAYVGRLMQAGMPAELEYEAYAGAAGEGFAAEFVGFLRIFRELPDPDAVLLNPQAADVPSKPAALYALCGALARKASAQNADRLFTYANRLPAEFSTLLMLDSAHLCPAVQKTRGFIDWQVKHQDIMI